MRRREIKNTVLYIDIKRKTDAEKAVRESLNLSSTGSEAQSVLPCTGSKSG